MKTIRAGFYSIVLAVVSSLAAAHERDHGTMKMMQSCMQGMQMMDANDDGTRPSTTSSRSMASIGALNDRKIAEVNHEMGMAVLSASPLMVIVRLLPRKR